MENVRIIDLKKDNIVQFQCTNKKFSAFQTAIVNRVYAEEFMLKTIWKAEVENQGGFKFTLTDNDDFVKVNEPFTRKVDMQEEQDSNIPNHYKGSENIDVIDFLYQQLPFEQFKGFMKGNMIKYPVRAGRKDDELADFKKARDYADRLIEKMED
ncbi:DUF3310 domain-containing protein [Staphylococcus haemolyticus]|uniref:DUF3310 domain-containing protein n=1 Tax=Staphylococcus haemolyticus TaxID=1283 RepID=UPI00187A55D0|nr:DUF3310 domain-containing protein [Staphylococcus haemolyticus]MBE7340804.1 DUF3310 domain-containing protein [Staphylococcus haemolyticus]MBE7352397.1 DUF3310 domain-containing protein [Staphylococcus haemolyticus]